MFITITDMYIYEEIWKNQTPYYYLMKNTNQGYDADIEDIYTDNDDENELYCRLLI